MRIVYLLLFFPSLLWANSFSEPHSPLDSAALAAIQTFVPKQWQAIALAQGDLNKDQQADYAVVVQSPEGLSTRRRLLVVLSRMDASQGLRLAHQYWRFIPTPAAGEPEPVAYIGIRDGLLETKFVPVGQGRSHHTYTFKYDGRRFVLHQFNRYQVNPRTAMFSEMVVDVEAGTRHSTSGSMSSPRHRKQQEDFMPSQVWTPCLITDPLSFEPQ